MQFYSIRAKTGGLWIAIIIFVPLALGLDWIVVNGIVWQYRASSFPTATATITHSEIVEHRGSKGGRTYTLDLIYQFRVGDQTFIGTRFRYYTNGTSNHEQIRLRHLEYPVGRTVVAYYPPEEPASAILHPGVEGTELLRALFAVGLSVLVMGAIGLAFAKRLAFNPDDPDCVRQTDTGWEAQMPATSHGAVFYLTLAAACIVSGLVLMATRTENPPPELVGAALAGSIAIAALAAVLFSRYPTLTADLDLKELTLPAPWFGSPIKVPFDQIGTIAVREEDKTAGRNETYQVYNCEIGWGNRERVQITTIATFLDRFEAEKLATWVKMTLGRVVTELDAIERIR
ncbi:MAG: hypothetical protein C0467_20445 [Planctomycetaceae bacterium]|nr:hypothetical protein [Planctomycetaceae bacterium]